MRNAEGAPPPLGSRVLVQTV